MTFTDHELAEWPALALLVGPHQPLPLRPDQLVMPANTDRASGTGMVASGYAYHTLVESILFGLVAKYKLPGDGYWLTLDDAIDFARMNLDGKDTPPGVSSMMRHNADAAVKQVEEHLLPEGLLLSLGSEFHDLDLEIDEEWAYRQGRAQARAVRRVVTAQAKADRRWSAERAGDVLAAEDADKPQTAAIAVITLATENGWSPGGQLGVNLGKAARIVGEAGGAPTKRSDLILIYNLLPAALGHLNQHVAPEDHRFEYAYGYLTLGPVPIPYPEVGVVVDADGFADEYELALEVLDLAQNLGRQTDPKWRRRLWRTEYEPLRSWPDFNPERILDAADRAIDWLNDEYARPDHIFEVDDAGLVLRERTS